MKPHVKDLWGLLCCFPASLENLLVFGFILSWFVRDSQSPRGPAEFTPGWKDRFCLYVNGCVSDWQRDVTCVFRPSLKSFLTNICVFRGMYGPCVWNITLQCSSAQFSGQPCYYGPCRKKRRLCWASVHSQKEKCKHAHLPLISTVHLRLMQNCVPVGLAGQVACHCKVIIEFRICFIFSLSFQNI